MGDTEESQSTAAANSSAQLETAAAVSRRPNITVSQPAFFLASPGPPAVPWESWEAAFNNYLLASGADELPDRRRQALLIHCLGTEGQRVYFNLQDTVPTTYDESLELLRRHFRPKVNVVAERYRFRQRGQRPGESISDFVAALRGLASKCNFGLDMTI